MAVSSKPHLIRRAILVVSLGVACVGLYRIGSAFFVDGRLHFGNPVSASARFSDPNDRRMAPRRIRAEVTRVKGTDTVKPGTRCEFFVQKRMLENGGFYCNAQVTCGSQLLYGGEQRGYFTCALYDGVRRDVVGSDPNTTSSDHDAAMHLDTQAGVLRVWDDAEGVLGAFEVDADVLSVE